MVNVKHTQPIIHSFTLTESGDIHLDKNPQRYQLVQVSRVSFIGCWLIMVPSESVLSQRSIVVNHTLKQFFIFKDSISEQDFSRLARVIKQLS
nr:hypothetical protein [Colwellia piezophila]